MAGLFSRPLSQRMHMALGLMGQPRYSNTPINSWGNVASGIGKGMLSYRNQQQAQLDWAKKILDAQKVEADIMEKSKAEVRKRIENANREAYMERMGFPEELKNLARSNPDYWKMIGTPGQFAVENAYGAKTYPPGHHMAGQPINPASARLKETEYTEQQKRLSAEEARKVAAEGRAVQAHQTAQTKSAYDMRAAKQKEYDDIESYFQKLKGDTQRVTSGLAAVTKAMANLTAFSTGTLANLKPEAISGDKERMEAHIVSINSALGLQNLIDIKNQGGTFGALSNQELGLLVGAAGRLATNMRPDDFRRELQSIQQYLQKAMGERSEEAQRLDRTYSKRRQELRRELGISSDDLSDIFQEADSLVLDGE